MDNPDVYAVVGKGGRPGGASPCPRQAISQSTMDSPVTPFGVVTVTVPM